MPRLLGAALLLGVTVGTAVGYHVQAQRPPTPLASLSRPGLVHPAKALPEGRAPGPLPASQDRSVKTAGDLRKLVVPRPAGARNAEHSLLATEDGPEWAQLGEMADWYADEGYMFENLAQSGIRRVAVDVWDSGVHRTTMASLYQFRPGDVAGAVDHMEGQLSYMPDRSKGAGNKGYPVKGSGNARAYLYGVRQEAGYLPMYRARAMGYKGDVFFDVSVFDTAPIPRTVILKLAEQQVGRL